MYQMNEKNASQVITNILALDPEDRDYILSKMDELLETLLAEDFFGTEGQLDPRGDHRD